MSRNVQLESVFASLAVAFWGSAAVAQEAEDAPSGQDTPSAQNLVVDEIPAEDRAASVVDPNWKAPRTSWGDPALHGVWSSDDFRSVPRERPEDFGTRERLTPEEFAKRAEADARQRDFILNQSDYAARSWGVRTFGYSSQLIDPPNGRMPAKTANAKPRSTRGSYSGGPWDDFEDFTLYDRCITRGMSSIMPTPAIYGNGVEIVQSPDTVSITFEMIHETRLIRLEDKAHPAGVEQYLGTSRGHWEGDTLVVETEGLTDKTNINDAQNSKSLKITERFRRIDPEMIEYVGTFNDPETFEAPFTYRLMLTAFPDYRIYEYSCHEGNNVVRGGLAGERVFEREAAEAQAKGLPAPERHVDLGRLPEDSSQIVNINEGGGSD
jgi:hypothetical protein